MKIIDRLTAFIIIGVCLTTALPILAAIALVRQQALEREDAHVTGLARAALSRAEITADQLSAGGRLVGGLTRQQACSDEGIDLLRRIDLSSTLLQAAGYIEGDVMICSSFGGNKPRNLGLPDFQSRTNAAIRTDVRLLDPDLPYLAVSRGAFVGIVHKDLALSFLDDTPGLGFSIFSWSHRQPLISRGNIDSRWFRAEADGDIVFRTGSHIVAIVRSSRYDQGAMAALPLAFSSGFIRESAIILIPIGIFVGLLLSAILIFVVRTRMSMPTMIRNGLKGSEFNLLYQPVVDLSSGTMMGVEALIRWRRNGKDFVPPETFIPVAEQAGIISLITARVFRLLAEDAPHILSERPFFHFAVNFSAGDMHRPGVVEEVRRFASQSGIALDNLVIEVTERSLVDVNLAGETMRQMRAAGIRVAIDDFGTGYSSLGYLAQLHVDYLKIDKLFVQALGTDSPTSQVAARIIEIAKDLNLQVIAEGIETKRQERILKGLHVGCAQGYLYGRPMPLDELLQLLRRKGSVRRLEAA
ncbi:EAL domain-containing protein [Sphingosinicella rhizophila]|uniref:cyclic-guanylate-specific phosphodiesterase n=1 Tax=Sphingosinicella rhizophila TaxID=3050082 RepID=A0ABU3QA18_9SPHN|nr:EAL domain-containing protein [Sphingosinicella sp. GR2756]MDT9600251.1 EAL domain-containing protein [Sphingosinicella sp. GR2756]